MSYFLPKTAITTQSPGRKLKSFVLPKQQGTDYQCSFIHNAVARATPNDLLR